MELLIAREDNILHTADGRSFVDSDVPEFLQSPLCISYFFIKHLKNFMNSDLLVKEPDNEKTLMEYYLSHHTATKNNPDEKYIGALWSGYRSALVRDPKTSDLYRLKGVALNPDSPEPMIEDNNIRIYGGQKRLNALYEAKMLKRFNRTLGIAGIEPVVEPKGIWKYPVLCKRHRPTASVFKVKGDTRLDELVSVIEGLAILKYDIIDEKIEGSNRRLIFGDSTPEGDTFVKYTSDLLDDVGFIVGRLMFLMGVTGQTWGSDDNATNAHWGNIVLYRDGPKLKVNFVDFDMSYGSDECSKSELDAMQFRETQDLINSFKGEGFSFRRINNGKPFSSNYYPFRFNDLRNKLIEGFIKGYSTDKLRYSNELDAGRLDEIFHLLREDVMFAVDPKNTNSYNEDHMGYLADKIDKSTR